MLKFNIGKIELLLIGSCPQLSKLCSPITIRVDDVTITASEIVRNLGVFIDEQLKLGGHVNKIIKTCFYHLRNIFKIRKYLSIDATKSLVHALVTSRLDYCNSLLYGCKTSSIKRLQRIQNYSARAICKIAKYDHISPVLKQLHWLPVKARIEHKLLTLTFKAVMVKPHPISLNLFLAVLLFTLVFAQITVFFSQSLKLHLEQTRVPQIELSLCLLQNFGTRSQRN